jgi:hypothetical protein
VDTPVLLLVRLLVLLPVVVLALARVVPVIEPWQLAVWRNGRQQLDVDWSLHQCATTHAVCSLVYCLYL